MDDNDQAPSELETLTLGWGSSCEDPDWGYMPEELHLPHLRALTLIDLPEEGPSLIDAPSVTHLALIGGWWPSKASLGVMPQLRQLVLECGMPLPSPAWLQQSPHLTSVRISAHVTGAWLQQLPEQLLELDLSGCSVSFGSLAVLVRLVSLRSLSLAHVHTPMQATASPQALAAVGGYPDQPAGAGHEGLGGTGGLGAAGAAAMAAVPQGVQAGGGGGIWVRASLVLGPVKVAAVCTPLGLSECACKAPDVAMLCQKEAHRARPCTELQPVTHAQH